MNFNEAHWKELKDVTDAVLSAYGIHMRASDAQNRLRQHHDSYSWINTDGTETRVWDIRVLSNGTRPQPQPIQACDLSGGG